MAKFVQNLLVVKRPFRFGRLCPTCNGSSRRRWPSVRQVGSEPKLYFNPSCSKCQTADSLLKERGIDATVVRYLDRAPTVEELRGLMELLGIDDPRGMMRSGEAVYSQLGLAEASPERVLEAIVEHPILLERPIFILGDRAVIARPPERLLELL